MYIILKYNGKELAINSAHLRVRVTNKYQINIIDDHDIELLTINSDKTRIEAMNKDMTQYIETINAIICTHIRVGRSYVEAELDSLIQKLKEKYDDKV